MAPRIPSRTSTVAGLREWVGVLQKIGETAPIAMEAASATPDGAVPEDLRALATKPSLESVESVMFGLDLTIIFLMTNKVGWPGSLVALAVGLAVSGALILRARQRHAAPAAAA